MGCGLRVVGSVVHAERGGATTREEELDGHGGVGATVQRGGHGGEMGLCGVGCSGEVG